MRLSKRQSKERRPDLYGTDKKLTLDDVVFASFKVFFTSCLISGAVIVIGAAVLATDLIAKYIMGKL